MKAHGMNMTSLCTSFLRIGLGAFLIALPCGSTGCVINEGGDDAGDDGTGGDDGADDGADDAPADDGADDAPADDGADDTPADDGADDGSDETAGDDGGDDGDAADGPEPGPWLYEETGGGSNDCAFLEDPSNGFGTYLVDASGPGAFTITPGDDTAPFDCTHDGATFECAERLQEELDAGGTILQVLVSASGDLVSATEMTGTQDGRIVCEGADCATAEELLGATFPCEFSVPWQGTKM
jgi:hypothetical protein